jgi:hypothetical protein
MPLVDPITREKVKFNPNVLDDGLVDADMLMSTSSWGGNVDFEYEHEKYWPALMELCKSRREEQMARWKALGAKVGIDEWSIKGGTPAPVVSEAKSVEAPVEQVVVTTIEVA